MEEENILAIIDTDSSTTIDSNAHDDRISFLQAVRVASLVPDPENATPPTYKMYEAVVRILRSSNSIELVMESYWLLSELQKRFPRVRLSTGGEEGHCELVMDEEGWAPFIFKLDGAYSGRGSAGTSHNGRFDSSGFHILVQDLSKVCNETNLRVLVTKSFGDMLLFQYLVNVLEEDFSVRSKVYKETMNWTVARESLLSMLLNSRRINYKGLVMDCMSIMCRMHQVSAGVSDDLAGFDDSTDKLSKSETIAISIAFSEVQKSCCSALEKLLILIMELDASRKTADEQGFTTRADVIRTPILEMIVDEFTYNVDTLSSFLEVFNNPKWKLEIIIQYLSKYSPKPAVRTRRFNSPVEDVTLNGVLKEFSNVTRTRNILKKIGPDVFQLMVAHSFQAHLSLSSSEEDTEETCKSMIGGFNSMRKTNEKIKILPIGKEALFTAATILSMKS